MLSSLGLLKYVIFKDWVIQSIFQSTISYLHMQSLLSSQVSHITLLVLISFQKVTQNVCHGWRELKLNQEIKKRMITN